MENKYLPINPVPHTNSDGTTQHDVYIGLSKREYFAALAMQGLLTRTPANAIRTDLGILECQRIAEEAIIIADTILDKLQEQ